MAIFQRDGADQGTDKETIIGPTVKVDGNFVGAGNVMVEGHVSGSLKTSKDLRIGEGATLKADIEAANIFLAGEVRGQVKCHGRLEIAATGKIFGNVDTKTIAIAHGAVMHGKVTMAAEGHPAPKKSSEPE